MQLLPILLPILFETGALFTEIGGQAENMKHGRVKARTAIVGRLSRA
jgi:hypothetical protein